MSFHTPLIPLGEEWIKKKNKKKIYTSFIKPPGDGENGILANVLKQLITSFIQDQ